MAPDDGDELAPPAARGVETVGPAYRGRRGPVVLLLLDCGHWRAATGYDRRALAGGVTDVPCPTCDKAYAAVE